nr:unnamed protein product [Callosobruchus chinensis]
MAKTKKLTEDEKLKKRREQERLSMRRARQKLYSDPEKHAEKKGEIEGIVDLSARSQRVTRKSWRKRAKKYRDKKKSEKGRGELLCTLTPPDSPASGFAVNVEENCLETSSSSRASLGKRISRRNRLKLQREKKELEQRIRIQQREINRLRVKLSRTKSRKENNKDSPTQKLEKELTGVDVTDSIRRNLHFGEVLVRQITQNFKSKKKYEEKRQLAKLIDGSLIRKYKYIS